MQLTYQRLICGAALLLFAFISSAGAVEPAASSEEEPVRIVRAYLDAFNRHDIDALVASVAPDFTWFNVTSDETTVEVKGPEALKKSLTSYFKSTQDVRSEMEGVTNAGTFVSFRERATWTAASGQRSASSLAVYEVRDGRIFRAWYFPAAK